MKRISSFLVIFLITATFSFSNPIITDIDYFSKLFPVNEGSDNEKAALKYITERLDGTGVEYHEKGFNETEGYHSFSTFIEAEIPGSVGDSLITVIPVESSYGTAFALSLIEHFSVEKPELSLRFIFLGAEQSSERNSGTRNFLEHYYPENPAALIYFNFSGIPESFKIVSGADGYSSPFFLYNTVTMALKNTGISYYHSNTEAVLFRLSAAGTKSRIKDYLQNGYPAIELDSYRTTNDASAVTTEPAVLAEFYTKLIDSYPDGIPADWDSHYIFGFSEQAYLFVYITMLTLLMIYPIFRRRHFGWYMKTLARNFWSLPLLFGFVLIFLSFSSFLLSFITDRLGIPELWKFFPVRIFFFKISVTLLIYTIAFKLIKKLPFSKRGSFYSISAIFFLVLALFILTWINLSLSFFALWPLCFIFLFTIMRKPAVKFIMLAASLVWIFFGLYEVFALPSLRVIKLITISPLRGDLLITLIMLPFILAAIRLDLLAPPSRKFTRFLPVILVIISAGMFLYIILDSPFNDTNPLPVTVTETINADTEETEYDVNSPMRLEGPLKQEIINLFSESGDKEDSMQLNIKSNSFLNRKIINASLSLDTRPEKIRFVSQSETPLVLYECNYPAEWFPSRKQLEVYVGYNPPVPLVISLTINKDADVYFTAEADLPVTTTKITINGTPYLVNSRKTVIKSNKDYEQK